MTVELRCMHKTIGQRFKETSRLYHFTTLKAAFSIIESRKLRFGKSFRQNDLIESNRVVFQRVLRGFLPKENRIDLFSENEMRRYQQISFSQDREYDGRWFMGFDLHPMWGLYADKGYGVCLVFDKDKVILEENDSAGDVHYENIVPQDFEFKNKSRSGIKDEVWRRRYEIFFNKRKEWEYEQEFRVIRHAKDEMDMEYLDVSDSLSFVIICKDYSICDLESMFDADSYHDLHYMDRKLPILTYEYGLDGYTLFEDFMVPIWSEQCGYM